MQWWEEREIDEKEEKSSPENGHAVERPSGINLCTGAVAK